MGVKLEIGPDKKLTIESVALLSEAGVEISLSEDARLAVSRSRELVEALIKNKQPLYGITTGFGKFKDVFIDEEKTAELQRNLIRSHSAGVGETLPVELVRAALLVRINSLAQGYSGTRLNFLETALAMLNADVIPVVPAQGSVGASGDLAPLSHMGLTLMGEGEVMYKGQIVKTKEALDAEHITPIQFSAKEGLAWTNGTSMMLGMLAIAVHRAKTLAKVSDIAAALTLESVRGVSDAFHPALHELRPYKGQKLVAKNILELIKSSKLVDSQRGRIQDSYSLRCVPQVHGASRDLISFVEAQVLTELNSVTDNPLIFPDLGKVIAGGNFHGEPLAQAADALCIAIAELANISERRSAKLVDNSTSEGLPLFLVNPDKAGLHSGMMIPQYTAAALVSENKVLSHPASVDSIPTSANQEDHVSMGSIACHKALKVLQNAENVLSIECLIALEAIEFLGSDNLGMRTKKAYMLLRERVAPVSEDRVLSGDINAIRSIVSKPNFANQVLNS